jgi:hypothetical protein
MKKLRYEELNNLRQKTKNIKISDDINIDDMINEMNIGKYLNA